MWTHTQSLKGQSADSALGFSGPSSISNLKELLHVITGPGGPGLSLFILITSSSSNLASPNVICVTQKTFSPVAFLPSTSASISSYNGKALVCHLTALGCACKTHMRSAQMQYCRIVTHREILLPNIIWSSHHVCHIIPAKSQKATVWRVCTMQKF